MRNPPFAQPGPTPLTRSDDRGPAVPGRVWVDVRRRETLRQQLAPAFRRFLGGGRLFTHQLELQPSRCEGLSRGIQGVQLELLPCPFTTPNQPPHGRCESCESLRLCQVCQRPATVKGTQGPTWVTESGIVRIAKELQLAKA